MARVYGGVLLHPVPSQPRPKYQFAAGLAACSRSRGSGLCHPGVRSYALSFSAKPLAVAKVGNPLREVPLRGRLPSPVPGPLGADALDRAHVQGAIGGA